MYRAIRSDPSAGLFVHRMNLSGCKQALFGNRRRDPSERSRSVHARHTNGTSGSLFLPSTSLDGCAGSSTWGKKKSRKGEKAVHEYASFMLTDTEPKQERGITRGSARADGKSRRCSPDEETKGPHLFLAGILLFRHFLSRMHETLERRK